MSTENKHTKRLFVSSHPAHQCCGEGLTYVAVDYTWNDEKPDFEDHYSNRDDYWFCEQCDKHKESRRYKDWFGRGDTEEEVHEVIEDKGEPLKVMYDGYMACMIYPDMVLVFGYDGNEYCHSFGFEAQPQDITQLNLRVKQEIVLIPDEEE
jgi:hypothetical protein